MREILFKAKRVDGQKWVEGDLVATLPRADLTIQAWIKPRSLLGLGAVSTLTEFFIEVDPETVCQFTGHLDKNGKKIFEGDIYYQGDTSITYTVIWKNLSYLGKQNGSSSYAGLEYWRDRIEIVGNIHDKKEDSNG